MVEWFVIAILFVLTFIEAMDLICRKAAINVPEEETYFLYFMLYFTRYKFCVVSIESAKTEHLKFLGLPK